MHTLILKLGTDDAGEVRYAWRHRDPRSGWCGAAAEGTAAALRESGSSEASLLLDGSSVVCSRLALKPAERRHLHTLAAYELEDSLVSAPESIHVASGPSLGAQTVVGYTDKASLQADIVAVEALGITVRHCVPLPVLLPRAEEGWTLALQDGCVHVHYGPGQAFSIETALAVPALQRLAATTAPPQSIDLYAVAAAGLDQLEAMLLQAWPTAQQADGRQVHRHRAPLWDILQDPAGASLDLRQGELACPLPWARWWSQARSAVLLAALALLVHVAVQWLQVLQLDARYRALEQESTAVYRSVMPDGALVDARQQLRSQLAPFEAGTGADVLYLLDALAPLMAGKNDMVITRLAWQGQRKELQLSLQAPSNSDILGLAEALQAQGLEAQARNMSRQGQLQTANLVVRELTP